MITHHVVCNPLVEVTLLVRCGPAAGRQAFCPPGRTGYQESSASLPPIQVSAVGLAIDLNSAEVGLSIRKRLSA